MSYVPDPSLMKPYTGWGSSNQAYSNNLQFRDSTLYVPDFTGEIAHLQAEIDAITQNPIDIQPFSTTPDARGLSEAVNVHTTDLTLHAASLTTPGGVSVAAQEFGGVKTLTSPVIKGIHGTTLVDRYVTVDAAGQLGTNTGGSSPPLPVFTQMIYVNKGGNDTTGNGSELAPYLTIPKAYLSITDASVLKVYAVVVGPGTYVEDVNIKPNVFLIGMGPTLTMLTGNIGNDNISWDYSSGTTPVTAGIIGIYNNDLLGTGEMILDMTRYVGRGAYVYFYIENCDIQSDIILTLPTVNAAKLYVRDSRFGNGFNTNGGFAELFNCFWELGGFRVDAPTLTNTDIIICGGRITNLNVKSYANPSYTTIWRAEVGSATMRGALNVLSTTETIPTLFLLDGATMVLLTKADFIKYVPTVPANWSTVPTQVAQALDLLANAGTSLTIAPPIPAFDANGVTIDMTSQLIMEIADETHPGIVTEVAQTFGGVKSFPAGIAIDNTRMIANTGARFLTTNAAANSIFCGNIAGNDTASGGHNTAVGALSGTALITGSGNTFMGYQSGVTATSSANCTYIGYRSGYGSTSGADNTCIGHQAGIGILNGGSNICIGKLAGQLITSTGDNICIANDGVGTDVGTIRIGGPSQTSAYMAGIRGVASGSVIDQQLCVVGTDNKLESGGITRLAYINYSATMRRITGTITAAMLNGLPAILDGAGAITMGPTIIGQIVGKMMTLSFPLVTVSGQVGVAVDTWEIVAFSPPLPTMVSSSVTAAVLFNNSDVVTGGYIYVSSSGALISFHSPSNLNLSWGMADGRCQITFPIA